ncbi:dihydrolipoyllysine-residue succinyltransferase [Alicyclobacillaceae bacterium I2511]|nr:dihydrolipoyllysine-residue succinyltransferase [Alicyclobacillaceae bacterium I2511]
MASIQVPELGESITEATVGQWLKPTGASVIAGEAVVELETDKVNLEVIAEASGRLSEVIQTGATVHVGDTLATLVETTGADLPVPAPSVDEEIVAVSSNTVGRLSPSLRRRLAVDAATAVAPQQPLGEPQALNSERTQKEQRIPMSRRRRTLASRLVQAQHTAAMLTTFNEVDMSAILDIRKRRRDGFKEKHGVNLGLMSFFTKAVVASLKEFPRLNAEIVADTFVLKYHYDIGIAVAAESGLVVPVLHDADTLNFAEIERQIADMATRARAGALSLAELQGGTFTLTNGGVFGSLLSTPILNGPQVGILGMHTIQERPVAIHGQVEIRPMMYLALSYDHRIVEGSEAVRFLVSVKGMLEDPESLLLEG